MFIVTIGNCSEDHKELTYTTYRCGMVSVLDEDQKLLFTSVEDVSTEWLKDFTVVSVKRLS